MTSELQRAMMLTNVAFAENVPGKTVATISA